MALRLGLTAGLPFRDLFIQSVCRSSNTCAINDKAIYLMDITNKNHLIRFMGMLISVPFNTPYDVFCILIYTDLYGPVTCDG